MTDRELRIAILAWGSLIWEPRPEFDIQREQQDWYLDGPTLKIEFSRISKSRKRALTLVIDDKNGSVTTVAWCLSKRHSVEDAICDLRSREGTTLNNIGCVCLTADASASTYPIIETWASEKHIDAVIWTALKSNFEEEKGMPFSVNAAVEHIKTLDPYGKAKAAEYVWRAPEFVRTRLREALQQEPWFSKAKTQV